MNIKNITKFISIVICAILINTTYINNVNVYFVKKFGCKFLRIVCVIAYFHFLAFFLLLFRRKASTLLHFSQ